MTLTSTHPINTNPPLAGTYKLTAATRSYLDDEEMSAEAYQQAGGTLDHLICGTARLIFQRCFGKKEVGAEESKSDPSSPMRSWCELATTPALSSEDFFTRLASKVNLYVEQVNTTLARKDWAISIVWHWWGGYKPVAQEAEPNDSIQHPFSMAYHKTLVNLAAGSDPDSTSLIMRLSMPRYKMNFSEAIDWVRFFSSLPSFGASSARDVERSLLYHSFAQRVNQEGLECEGAESKYRSDRDGAYFAWWNRRVQASRAAVDRKWEQLATAKELLTELWAQGFTGWQSLIEENNPIVDLRTSAAKVEELVTSLLKNPRFFTPQLKQSEQEGRGRLALEYRLCDANLRISSLPGGLPSALAEAKGHAVGQLRITFLRPQMGVPLALEFERKKKERAEFESVMSHKIAQLEALYSFEEHNLVLKEVSRCLPKDEWPEGLEEAAPKTLEEEKRSLKKLKEEIAREKGMFEEEMSRRTKELEEPIARLRDSGYGNYSRLLANYETLEHARAELREAEEEKRKLEEEIRAFPQGRLETEEERDARVLNLRSLVEVRKALQGGRIAESERLVRAAGGLFGEWFTWRADSNSALLRIDLEYERASLDALNRAELALSVDRNIAAAQTSSLRRCADGGGGGGGGGGSLEEGRVRGGSGLDSSSSQVNIESVMKALRIADEAHRRIPASVLEEAEERKEDSSSEVEGGIRHRKVGEVARSDSSLSLADRVGAEQWQAAGVSASPPPKSRGWFSWFGRSS